MAEPNAAAKSELAERIRAVALEEFAARGYGVSLQQIAEKSGCTKASRFTPSAISAPVVAVGTGWICPPPSAR